MARYFAWSLLAAFLYAPAALAEPRIGMSVTGSPQHDEREKAKEGSNQSNCLQERGRTKWWLEPSCRSELGITDQQSADIDQVFEATIPKLRASYRDMTQAEEALSTMIKENTADVATITAQVKKYEKLRAEHNTTRTVMLYRMYLPLGPEQRKKLDEMRARREESRRRQHPERSERH